MDVPKSTVRFAQVVKKSGRPEPVTLWVSPEKDPGFQAAVRRNRVLTVFQETVGTHKDFGVVGFQRAAHASYWAFPKSLAPFNGKRVIGIKYDLVQTAAPKSPVKPAAEPAKKSPPKHDEKSIKHPDKKPLPTPVEGAKPALVRYRVTIRCLATVDVQREVEAKTAKAAGELALGIVANEPVDLAAGNVSRKIVAVGRAEKT